MCVFLGVWYVVFSENLKKWDFQICSFVVFFLILFWNWNLVWVVCLLVCFVYWQMGFGTFVVCFRGTFMAYPSDHRSSSRGTVRFVLVLVGLFLVIYMVTTPTLRHSKALSSCPPCFCDCEEDPMFSPIGQFISLWMLNLAHLPLKLCRLCTYVGWFDPND